ncbi:MAG: hypothetical protein R6V06_09995 [Kiritimatiellia bacterium]
MKLLKGHIFIAGMLFCVVLKAAAGSGVESAVASKKAKTKSISSKASRILENSAGLERQMEIYKHAAANRELAALAQMEHARKLQDKARQAASIKDSADDKIYRSQHAKAGALEKSAAVLYGKACANFDKAASNQAKGASLSKKLGKVEQHRNAEIDKTNLKLRGSEALRLAAEAGEAAAVAYDKAEDLGQVALNSQMAASWLEKLAER